MSLGWLFDPLWWEFIGAWLLPLVVFVAGVEIGSAWRGRAEKRKRAALRRPR